MGASTANYTHHPNPNFPRLVSSTGAEFLISGAGDPNFEFPISLFQVLTWNMLRSLIRITDRSKIQRVESDHYALLLFNFVL